MPDLVVQHPRLAGDGLDHVVAVEALQRLEEVERAAGAAGAAHVDVDDREAEQVGDRADRALAAARVGVAVARVLDQGRVGPRRWRRAGGRRSPAWSRRAWSGSRSRRWGCAGRRACVLGGAERSGRTPSGRGGRPGSRRRRRRRGTARRRARPLAASRCACRRVSVTFAPGRTPVTSTWLTLPRACTAAPAEAGTASARNTTRAAKAGTRIAQPFHGRPRPAPGFGQKPARCCSPAAPSPRAPAAGPRWCRGSR